MRWHRAGLEIATGAGIVLRELLRELGLVVLLTANEEVIYERVSRAIQSVPCSRPKTRAGRSPGC